MICGIGIDLVEIDRIEKILKRWGERFTDRVYTEDELEYCQKRAHPATHFAARFAAKEAFLKSIGVGLAGEITLKDIEVLTNQQGKPYLNFSDRIKPILNRCGGTPAVHLSITHTSKYATAVVVLENRVPSSEFKVPS
ncbi:MAG: holo-ACP synthase [Syntrophales bacterium]|nr:holo-ACP synthase [Syntrophales bacterium]